MRPFEYRLLTTMTTPLPELFYTYWGKTTDDPHDPLRYHLLPYHCLDVAAVGSVLIERDPHLLCRFTKSKPLPEDVLLRLIPFFLAMHDVGKFSVRFQNLKPQLLSLLQDRTSYRDYIVRHDDMAMILVDPDLLGYSREMNWFRHDQPWEARNWNDAWRPWFRAVSGHHGVPPKKPAHNVNQASLFDSADRAAARAFGDACATLFIGYDGGYQSLTFHKDPTNFFKRTSWLIAGLAVLSDWIGSGTYFQFHSEPMPLREYWSRFALPTAEKAVEEAGVLPSRVSSHTGMANLFPQLKTPTTLQETVSHCQLHADPELFIIEEATGGGKTEAALVLAHRLIEAGAGEGIFIGLPTMATADAMYERLGKAYQRIFADGEHPSLVLAHSARHLSDTFRQSIGPRGGDVREHYGEEEATASAQCTVWLADNRKKSLLASVGVGTIDQALMSILPFRHQSLRLLGLARNILIVDEVHAYDAYMHTLLQHLLEFHAALGGSAILLSATLPMHQRQDLIASFCKVLGCDSVSVQETAYPLVTRVSANGLEELPITPDSRSHRYVQVELTSSLEDVEDRLRGAVTGGQCACWVRNTVKDAILAYERLSALFGKERVTLFHARFAMGDRLTIERKVLKQFGKESTREERQGQILIATQVVEQSLDLDFDVMVTDLAPMDLIIQRSGRLHRHLIPERGDRGTPTLLVLAPPLTDTPDEDWYMRMFPTGAFVYPKHGQLWLTARCLAKQGQIVMPGDARDLIEGVFDPDVQATIPEALMERDMMADGKDRGDKTMANLNALALDDGYVMTPGQWQEDTRTPTRLDEMSVTVVLARWNGEVLRPWSDAAEFAWDMSQVSVRETMISGSADSNDVPQAAINAARETMPGKGVGRILIPLTQTSGERWEGLATARKGDDIHIVSVIYEPRTGLRVVRDGE
jgi:CRISPR-associated endonuclease/helicase Cas3